ncbi:hypothetical protein J2T13_002853 [Paenibacillus sp. DS2015]|uniref:O-antigen ligase family protein n=1 Tax=Paenibacillus sp. DS2015 TaxID=3373917 RepID=UPI003D19C173
MNSRGLILSYIAVITIGVASCLYTGIFFAIDLYPILLILSVVCLIVVYPILNKSRRVQWPVPDRLIKLILICPFFMMGLYLLHVFMSPLSLQGTTVELMKWGLYSNFAILAYRIGRTERGKRILQLGWHIMGGLLTSSALLTVYGVIHIPYSIIHTDNIGISATGARLAGLLQYPNTFGVILAAFLLERLFALASLAQRRTSTRSVLLYNLPLLPYTAALLLSESRGAWLAAGLAAAAGLVLERRRLAPPLLLAAAPMACAAVLYRQLTNVQLAPPLGPGLMWLAGLWAGSVLAGLLLWRLWHSRHFLASAILPRARKGSVLILAGLLWMVGLASIWTTVHERLTANLGTVSARGIIYRDAWRLAQQSPWIGQGGYTWRWSYLAVQSQPYVGSEVHNGYLDMLLNTGLMGLIIVLILLMAVGIVLLKNNRLLLPSYLVLVLHSAVDFDWSYSLSWILLFWLMAWGAAVHGASDEYSERNLELNTARNSERNLEHIFPRHLRTKIIPVVMLVVWLVATLGLTTLAFRGEMGSRLYRQALHTSNKSASQALFRNSLRWNPVDMETVLALVQRASSEQERLRLLRNSLSYAPNHPRIVWEISKTYGAMEQVNAYVEWLNKGLSLDPYNVDKWDQSLEGIYHLSQSQRQEGKINESRLLVDTGREIYLKYQKLLSEVNQHEGNRNDRDFKLTDEAEHWGNKLEILALAQAQVVP